MYKSRNTMAFQYQVSKNRSIMIKKLSYFKKGTVYASKKL